MSNDIGESIVGSYLRHVRGCDLVLYNSFTGEGQGEIDVIGIRSQDNRVWLCEVATHIRGLQYDASAEKSRKKLGDKIDRAKSYADRIFTSHAQHFEVWSPYVPVGAMTNWMAEETARRASTNLDVSFVVNQRYADALNQLIKRAGASTATTGEDAFRMLQILTHLRGELAW